MNRKWIALLSAVVLILITGVPVSAGGINGAEASVIAAAQSVFEYDGKQYVADGWCIDALYGKFSEDGFDLSDLQASSLISMGYANIGRGVAEGYLIQIGGSSQEPSTEKTEPQIPETESDTQKEHSKEESKTEDSNREEFKEESKDKNQNQNNNENNQQNQTPADPYIRSDAIAGLGAVREIQEEEKISSGGNYILKYILLQIFGLLPDMVQQTLLQFFSI